VNWAEGQRFQGIEKLILSKHNDRYVGTTSRETVTVFGGAGDDYMRAWNNLAGVEGENRLFGGKGNDILSGDNVFGGPGNDILIGQVARGGSGNDTITNSKFARGGAGADTFIFDDSLRLDDRYYTISDFDPSEGDQIVFNDNPPFYDGWMFGFINFKAMYSDTIEVDGNAVITFRDGSLTLKGISKDELEESWFSFDGLDWWS